MNKDEYIKRSKELQNEYEKSIKQLVNQYALANNTIQIDDIIEGNGYIIQVKKIFPCKTFLSDFPECFYKGIQLKKDLKPMKKQDSSASVYQCNAKIIKKAGEKWTIKNTSLKKNLLTQ